MLTKNDLPPEQRRYFDEENAKLQLILDMNQNGVPEYIICGVSDSMLHRDQKGAYFIAMFEQTEAGIQRRYLQRLWEAPVNLQPSDNHPNPSVVLSFAFHTDFAAEIYFEDNEYRLDKWFEEPEEF